MQGKLRNMTSIYITSGDKMLLLYRIGSRVVAPCWCGIGGHFEKEELNDAGSAALRELQEEIGLSESDLQTFSLRYITLRNKNGEIRQNYYFFADLKEGVQVQSDCTEGVLEWVDVDKVLEREMPLSAKYMMEHYLATGRENDLLYCGATCESGMQFAALEEF